MTKQTLILLSRKSLPILIIRGFKKLTPLAGFSINIFRFCFYFYHDNQVDSCSHRFVKD